MDTSNELFYVVPGDVTKPTLMVRGRRPAWDLFRTKVGGVLPEEIQARARAHLESPTPYRAGDVPPGGGTPRSRILATLRGQGESWTLVTAEEFVPPR